MKLLALMTNTEQTACTRFRLLQYRPYLEKVGIELDARPLLDRELEKALYQPGSLSGKSLGLLKAVARRARDLIDGINADVIYVLREASLIGPPFLEMILGKGARRPIIFDVDDPVWKSYSSPVYGRLAMLLKMPKKANTLFRMATHVVAGNEYVASYARKLNSNVSVIPTVVDTTEFAPRNRDGEEHERLGEGSTEIPTVGWVGSHSTAPYLESVMAALQAAAWKTPFRLLVVGAGRKLRLPSPTQLPGTELIQKRWRLETEISSFQELDVGLYPIQKDRWSVGKSAFKAIQYGAVGIPTVASPVGAVRNVVVDGKTGILAHSAKDWIEGVSLLAKDDELRHRLGRNARKRIQERFSLQAWGDRWVEIIKKATSS